MWLVSTLLIASWLSADSPATEKGAVAFEPRGDQKNIPERYRLSSHRFDFEMTKKKDLPVSGVAIHELRFPSPVKSACPENNTVYAEYYVPAGKGPFPGVIVLDITGGDQTLSRTFARHFAQNQIAGLFVQMAYYGPRRPKGSKLRLMSTDIEHTLDAIRQTVLDMRRATAWMESRPELDKDRLGIMGTSLGSFLAALTCEMEPKLGRVAVLLGGGGFVEAYYDHPLAKPYRKVFESLGGTRRLIENIIAPVDPLTRADLLKDRKVLIVGAKNDEIVPAKMAENLWKASGEQRILWLNAGHFTAAVYLIGGLQQVVEHFK